MIYDRWYQFVVLRIGLYKTDWNVKLLKIGLLKYWFSAKINLKLELRKIDLPMIELLRRSILSQIEYVRRSVKGDLCFLKTDWHIVSFEIGLALCTFLKNHFKNLSTLSTPPAWFWYLDNFSRIVFHLLKINPCKINCRIDLPMMRLFMRSISWKIDIAHGLE